MKSKTAIWHCLLTATLFLLVPSSPAESVRFAAYGYQCLLIGYYYPNYMYASLQEVGGPTTMLTLTGTGNYGDYVFGSRFASVNVTCGKNYNLRLNGNTGYLMAGMALGFYDTPPPGYMYEIKDNSTGMVSDNVGMITGVHTASEKTWKVSLKPKRVHFSVDPISATGLSTSQAQLDFLSGTTSNYFTGNPVWSILGDNLGCTIDAATGWVRGGKEDGEITVMAVDSNGAARFVTGSLRIGCVSCNRGCGIGQGAVGLTRNALAVNLGVFPADNSFMGSIRLKLTNSPTLTTPAGLVYNQISTDNGIPKIINDANGLRQVMTPQCLADVVTTAAGYEIRLYWPENAGNTNSAGLQVPINTPFKVWSVTSLANNQFSIIEDPANANRTNSFTWNSNDNSWTLNTAGMVQQCKAVQNNPQSLFRLPASQAGEVSSRTETLDLSLPGDSVIASRIITTYATLDLGTTNVFDVLMEEDADGSAADGSAANPSLTTSYSYAPTATSDGHEKLLRATHSDGSWEQYEYSGDLISKIYTPWGDSAPSSDPGTAPTAAHKETDYDYTRLPGDAGTDLVTPRKIETYVQDSAAGSPQLVSRSYVLLTIDTNDYPMLNVRADIVCQTPGAAWNDPGNLVTLTRTYLNGANKAALHSIDRPDGTRTDYAYSQLSDGISTLTEVREGAINTNDVTAITDGRITKTTFNGRGYVQSTLVTDFISGKTLVSDVWSIPGANDPQGRYTLLTHLDGTTETFTYDCCSLIQQTNREGVVTTYTPDALKRPWITTVYGIQTQNIFDASGNVTKTTRYGATATEVLPWRKYDRAGREISEQNALLGTTSIVEGNTAAGGRKVTTTNPDFGTRIEEYYCDGHLAKVYGTAVQPSQYEYGFDATAGQLYTQETKLDTNAAPTSEWTKTYLDFAGRGYKTVYADATAAACSQKFYNDNGQL
jgi:hypothetical protein